MALITHAFRVDLTMCTCGRWRTPRADKQFRRGFQIVNGLTLPYRVSQWLPLGYPPPHDTARRRLLFMNINMKKNLGVPSAIVNRVRRMVAGQLTSQARRLELPKDEVMLAPPNMADPREAARMASSSTFCICPTGDSKGFTARFYTALLHGCLPVRIDGYQRNATLGPPVYPFPHLIDWSKIVVDVHYSEVHSLLPRLLAIPKSQVAHAQQYLRRVSHWLLTDVPGHEHHDAPAALLHELHVRLHVSDAN